MIFGLFNVQEKYSSPEDIGKGVSLPAIMLQEISK